MTDQDVADQVASAILGPRVDTGCDNCRFLGYMGDYDLFYCDQGRAACGVRVFINEDDARWCYWNESEFEFERPLQIAFTEAKRRAQARGLV